MTGTTEIIKRFHEADKTLRELAERLNDYSEVGDAINELGQELRRISDSVREFQQVIEELHLPLEEIRKTSNELQKNVNLFDKKTFELQQDFDAIINQLKVSIQRCMLDTFVQVDRMLERLNNEFNKLVHTGATKVWETGVHVIRQQQQEFINELSNRWNELKSGLDESIQHLKTWIMRTSVRPRLWQQVLLPAMISGFLVSVFTIATIYWVSTNTARGSIPNNILTSLIETPFIGKTPIKANASLQGSTFNLVILNGTDVPGLAAQLQKRIGSRYSSLFGHIKVGNAANSGFSQTTIEMPEKAIPLLSILPQELNLQTIRLKVKQTGEEIYVILGLDYAKTISRIN
ncbi:MAG: hypothetical protein D6748_04105 [Calditrichaeota bacterium]|nr:MAG: hypothetical protein D6748_04105 [Calditrichota bacterium]